MAIVPSNFGFDIDYIQYQALGKLSTLGGEIAVARKLSNPDIKAKIKQATQIRIWLKALSYSAYITREQKEKIALALTHIAEINAFGVAPLLPSVDRPNILIGGGGGTTIVNNNYQAGTAFENSDVDTGTEIVDTFATSLANGVVYHYTVINSAGTAARTGIFKTSWLSSGTISDGSDESDAGVGVSTDDVTLSCAIVSGNVRLNATALSNNWIVRGIRYLTNN
jgi:hypothetical protein